MNKGDSLINALARMDSSLVSIESKMIQMKFTGTGQDAVRYPVRTAERLSYLASAVQTADFRPADQHQEVFEILHERVESQHKELSDFLEGPLAEFMTQLDQLSIGAIQW